MKKGKLLILSVMLPLFILLNAKPAMAQDTHVYDLAELLDEEEEALLSEKAEALKNKMDMDVAIVTTEENPDLAEEFADRFYEENGLGTGNDHAGAMLLIDMENGELWITTEGRMLRYLTDGRIETILDDTYEYAADGDFYGTAAAFLEDVEICYENGIASDQYNYDSETGKVSRYHSIRWYEFLFALIAAAACGGGAVLGVVREYQMRDDSSKMAANFRLSYRKDSSFKMGNVIADVLLGSYVTHQVIASADNNRSKGGSFGGHSLSSGGRTTTHRSSSGRVHGGGGRKFR